MGLYEINLHLSGKLDDKEAGKFLEELKKKITKTGIKILKETHLKKISLAYPIKKQNYTFNGCLLAEAEGETIKTCENLLTDGNILRSLILKRDSVPFKFLDASSEKAERKTKRTKQDIKRTKKSSAKTGPKKESKKTKIKLEDIDKSLKKLLEKEI